MNIEQKPYSRKWSWLVTKIKRSPHGSLKDIDYSIIRDMVYILGYLEFCQVYRVNKHFCIADGNDKDMGSLFILKPYKKV